MHNTLPDDARPDMLRGRGFLYEVAGWAMVAIIASALLAWPAGLLFSIFLGAV